MADDTERVRVAADNENDAQNSGIEPGEAFAEEKRVRRNRLVPSHVFQKGEDPNPLPLKKRVAKNKTPDAVAAEFLALIEQGVGQRQAAIKVNIHLRTAQRLLAKYDADFEAIQSATRQILAVEALDRVDDWRTAARVGAAKRGNHLPAKDWLLHAGIIEPMSSENGGGIKIAINIGTEDKPMKILSPLATIEQGDDH